MNEKNKFSGEASTWLQKPSWKTFVILKPTRQIFLKIKRLPFDNN